MGMVKHGAMFVVCVMLMSCAQRTQDKGLGFEVHGVIFYNDTANDINDLKLLVNRNGRFVSCGYIPSGGECSTTFPAKEYQGGTLTLSWDERQGNQIKKMLIKDFFMPMPSQAPKGEHYKGLFHLGASGGHQLLFI